MQAITRPPMTEQHAMILLVDIGNTRIKWAVQSPLGLSLQQAAPHAGWSVGDVHQRIGAQISRPERIVVSNVAGPRLAALLTEAANDAWGIQPTFVHSTASACGVHNAYKEPDKLGVDRWLGSIAAHQMESGPVCVVSIGTAMTIDAIDASGQHLGGLIVPGPDLMNRCLLIATSDIAARSGEPQASGYTFAADTASAVRQGTRHALAALIDRSVEWLRLEACQQPTVILTGGASEQIEPFLGFAHKSIPDLVLRGLAIVAAI